MGSIAIVDAAAGQSWDETVSTAGMTVEIDPKVEWMATFHDAWRIMRDYFYDPGMHGVDWEGVRKQYEPMVEDCASRADLSFVIGEMIGELNVGHSYYMGGESTEQAAERVRRYARLRLRAGRRRIQDLPDLSGRPVGLRREGSAEPARHRRCRGRLHPRGERRAGRH